LFPCGIFGNYSNIVTEVTYYLTLTPTGYFTYNEISKSKNSAEWLHCIYVLCMALRTNSNVGLIHHQHWGVFTARYAM